jgi:hypothetical protein
MPNDDSMRCPVCGIGVVANIAYDAQPDDNADLEQQPDSREIVTYDCGHEVVGQPLKRADESLDVERRDSDETVAPLPDDER